MIEVGADAGEPRLFDKRLQRTDKRRVSPEPGRPLQKRKSAPQGRQAPPRQNTRDRASAGRAGGREQVSMSFDYEDSQVHPYTQEVSRLGKTMDASVSKRLTTYVKISAGI